MKTAKFLSAVLALVCITFASVLAAPKFEREKRAPIGIPYSLAYMAKHSPNGKAKSYFDSHVIFKEYGADYTVYRTYDWQVTFYQNGGQVASFHTDDNTARWAVYSPADEEWIGGTCDVPAGTYTVVVQNISGVGGTYDVGVNFTDADGYNGTSYKWDWISDRQDAVLENVYVDGTHELEVYVSKTLF